MAHRPYGHEAIIKAFSQFILRAKQVNHRVANDRFQFQLVTRKPPSNRTTRNIQVFQLVRTYS